MSENRNEQPEDDKKVNLRVDDIVDISEISLFSSDVCYDGAYKVSEIWIEDGVIHTEYEGIGENTAQSLSGVIGTMTPTTTEANDGCEDDRRIDG